MNKPVINISPDVTEISADQPGLPNKIEISKDYDFDFLSVEYRDLYEASDATAFQSADWLAAFYDELAPRRNATKLVITGRDLRSGELIFVLPLIQRKIKNIILVESADLGVSDYSAPVVHNRHLNGLLIDKLISKNVSDAIGKYDLLRIKPIREETRHLWELFFKTTSRQLDFSAHASQMHAPYDVWRKNAFGKSHTKYIDRKFRRFNKDHAVTLEKVSGDEIEDAINYVQQKRKGRFDGDPIQEDFVLKFYTRVAKNPGSKDIARTYQLMADGQRAGVVFGLIKDNRYHYLLIGCDYDQFGKHSPGLIMYDLIMADWLSEGGDIFDFTIGDEPFKASFGTKPTQMYEILKAGSPLGKLARIFMKLKTQMNTSS